MNSNLVEWQNFGISFFLLKSLVSQKICDEISFVYWHILDLIFSHWYLMWLSDSSNTSSYRRGHCAWGEHRSEWYRNKSFIVLFSDSKSDFLSYYYLLPHKSNFTLSNHCCVRKLTPRNNCWLVVIFTRTLKFGFRCYIKQPVFRGTSGSNNFHLIS